MTQSRNLPLGESSILNIGLDWSKWLKTDTISTSEWYAAPEITLTRKQNTSTVTACYVTGGVLGKTYRITNQITTADGKVDSRYITIVIDNQSA